MRLLDALFPRTRQRTLAFFFRHPGEEFHLREAIRRIGGGHGGVQREIQALAASGILLRRVQGNQTLLSVNRDAPIFPDLRGCLMKTAGLVDVLREALAPLAERIRVAFVYGSFARGEEDAKSDVDVLVIGDVPFGAAVEALNAAQETLGRDVNPVVYSAGEMRERLAAGHHFVTEVLRGPKTFVMGDNNDIDRLVRERVDHGPRGDGTGNRRTPRRRRSGPRVRVSAGPQR